MGPIEAELQVYWQKDSVFSWHNALFNEKNDEE
jgi:hypothetical protein